MRNTLLLITVMGLACCSDHPHNNALGVKANDTVPVAPVPGTTFAEPKAEPVVSLFEYSDCKEGCNDDERIIFRHVSAFS